MVFPWFSHGSQVKRLEEESTKALEEAEKAAQAARDAAEHALQAGVGWRDAPWCWNIYINDE